MEGVVLVAPFIVARPTGAALAGVTAMAARLIVAANANAFNQDIRTISFMLLFRVTHATNS
jgi:hypothetical protein